MHSFTFGGLLKDYRIKRRLSQREVSLRVGWKETSRLSKIEQGRVGKPTRATAEKIIQALDLDEKEKGELLYLSGYLPSDAAIEKAVKEYRTMIDDWPYPAYMIDFSWRLLYYNSHAGRLLKIPKDWKSLSSSQKQNILEIGFINNEINKTIKKGTDKNKLYEFNYAQIARFKEDHVASQNENWYRKLIDSLMKYEQFRQFWSESSSKNYNRNLDDYEYIQILSKNRNKEEDFLKFHIFTVSTLDDPRFHIAFFSKSI